MTARFAKADCVSNFSCQTMNGTPTAAAAAATFLQLKKATDRRVFVNYDLSGAKTAIAPASQRFSTQVAGPAAGAKRAGGAKAAGEKKRP